MKSAAFEFGSLLSQFFKIYLHGDNMKKPTLLLGMTVGLASGVAAAQGAATGSQPPWVAITVALIALIGVAYNTFFTIRSLDKRVKDEIENKRTETATQQAHSVKIVELTASLKAISEQDGREWELWAGINEKNYSTVLDNVRALKLSALELIENLINVCSNGSTIGDEAMIDLTHTIVKFSREFRDKMKPLFAEIRTKDYAHLKEFYRYQTEVLLDISRTQPERRANQSKMDSHARKLEEELEYFEKMAGAFLRPSLMLRSTSRRAEHDVAAPPSGTGHGNQV